MIPSPLHSGGRPIHGHCPCKKDEWDGEYIGQKLLETCQSQVDWSKEGRARSIQILDIVTACKRVHDKGGGGVTEEDIRARSLCRRLIRCCNQSGDAKEEEEEVLTHTWLASWIHQFFNGVCYTFGRMLDIHTSWFACPHRPKEGRFCLSIWQSRWFIEVMACSYCEVTWPINHLVKPEMTRNCALCR